MSSSLKSKGFTLVELIAVIVILAIIGTFSSQFVVSTIENYQTSVERTQLIREGRLAMERITRQVRGALPNSVRATVSGSNTCLEFIPVVGGGYYLDELPDVNNGAAAVSTISTSSFSINDGQGDAEWVYIAPLAGEPYSGGVSVRAALSSSLSEGATGSSLSLDSATVFERNSVSQRFYLTTDPQAFCLDSGDLVFESDYGAPGSTVSSGGPLLASSVSGSFAVSAGSVDRNVVILIVLTFSKGDQSATLSEQVFVRNVP